MVDSPKMKSVEKVLEDLRQTLHSQEGVDKQIDDLNLESLAPEQLQSIIDSLTNNMQAAAPNAGYSIHWSIYVASFIILFTFVGFFGYRLVRSLNERERKKEEKKKLKELKKKK